MDEKEIKIESEEEIKVEPENEIKAGAEKKKKTKREKKIKTRRKRPLPIRILVAIVSFFIFGIIFCCFLLLILGKTIDNLHFERELLIKPFEHAKLGEIKVGGMFNDFKIGKGYDKDADIAECIYKLLPPETKYLFKEEELREAMNASDALIYFVANKSIDYLYVAAGKDEETCITNEEVMNLIRDYEPIIAGIIGSDRIFSDSLYVSMKDGLEKTNIEKLTRLDRDTVTKELDVNLIEMVDAIKAMSVAVPIIIIVISVGLLLILDLRRKRRVFLICGLAAFLSSFFAYVFVVMLNAFTDGAIKRFPYATILLEEIRDFVKNAFVNACATVRSFGLVMILVYAGIRIWQHIRLKKEKKSLPAAEKT